MRSLLLSLLVLSLAFLGCDGTAADDTAAVTGIYVANQGNFVAGDGSVTIYDPDAGTQTELGRFGAIIQSLTPIGGRLFVALNTGARLAVVNLETNALVGEVPVVNPRYVVATGPSKAYVSSQVYDGSPGYLTAFNPATLAVLDTVQVGGFAEAMAAVGNRLYVATGTFEATREVVVVDANTDRVVQRIDTGCDAPRYVAADGDGEVWVLCAGTLAGGEGAVVVLSGTTGAVVKRFDIDGQVSTPGPGQDGFYADGELYVVRDQNTLLRFDTAANTLAATLPVAGDPISAVAYDPDAERLYVGRSKGFTAAGRVTIHDRTGAEVGAFAAGVVPSHIAFERAE